MSFDPYIEWLGVETDERPPNHYALLGLQDFEQDEQKIHHAALAQVAKLRKYQAGKNSELSQQLMNEVSQARVCLVDAERRAEYAGRLRMKQAVAAQDGPSKSPLLVSVVAAGAVTLLLIAGAVGAFFYLNGRKSGTTPPIASSGSPELETASAPSPTAPALPPEVQPQQRPSLPPSSVEAMEGLRVQWEEAFSGEPNVPAVRYMGDPSRPLFREGALTFEVDRGHREDVYLPVPEGACRFLVRYALKDFLTPGQSVQVGVYAGEERFVSVDVAAHQSQHVARRFDDQKITSPSDVVAVTPPSFWFAVTRIKNRWTVQASSDAELFQAIGKPVVLANAIAFGIRVVNDGQSTMRASFDYLRIEGNDDQYSKRVSEWPPHAIRPGSEAIVTQFPGRLSIATDGTDRLTYPLDSESSVKTWKATLTDEKSAMTVPPGTEIEHGPLFQIRRISFRIVFTGLDAKLRFHWSRGGELVLDAARSEIRVNGGAKPLSFEAGKQYACDVVARGNTVRVRVDNKLTTFPNVANLDGRLSTQVIGTHAVQLSHLIIDGRYDALTLWMQALRGEENIITELARRPDHLTVKTVAPPDSQSESWTRIIERFEEADVALPLEQEPVNLGALNTPGDESHPFLESDGRRLHFARRIDGEWKLHFGRRSEPGRQFSELGRILNLPETGSQPGVALDPSLRRIVFCSNHRAQQTLSFYQATRDDAAGPFSRAERIEAVGNDVFDPHFSPFNSDRLYFAQQDADGIVIRHTDRIQGNDFYQDPESEGLPLNFRSPSVTGDGLTMYLQGRHDERWAVFRTTRDAPTEEWSKPRRVASLASDTGNVGDAAPCVSPDGKVLYFASDRSGGRGGLDLWAVNVENLASEKMAGSPPAGDGHNVAIQETIPKWLVLGPIAKEDVPNSDDERALRRLVPTSLKRRVPRVGDKLDDYSATWRIGAIGKTAGIYLVCLPFRLENTGELLISVRRSPGGAFFWLDRNETLSVHAFDPWGTSGLWRAKSKPLKRFSGKHRLFGVICVAEPTVDLEVQLLEAGTEQPLEGVITDFP